LAVVWALPLRWYLQVGLAAAVLTVLAYEVAAKVLFRVSWQVREATWGADRTWTLELQDGTRIEAQLLPSSFVSQGLVVLNFRCGRWRICNLVLLSDALDADILRRLRVRLRLWGAADGQGRDALP
jgi:toxin CptA